MVVEAGENGVPENRLYDQQNQNPGLVAVPVNC